MNHEDQSAREKLITATIACIEKEGIHSVTIRSIAREAGVNSAAINYYYGTKDKLVEAALAQAMDNAVANFEMLAVKDREPFQVVQEFFEHNFDGIINYPEIVKAKLYNAFTRNECDPETQEWFGGFLEQLCGNIGAFFPNSDPTEVKMAVSTIMAAMIMPSIFPGLWQDFLDFKDPAVRKEYIAALLKHYFK